MRQAKADFRWKVVFLVLQNIMKAYKDTGDVLRVSTVCRLMVSFNSAHFKDGGRGHLLYWILQKSLTVAQ
jgi:hypothetical protein